MASVRALRGTRNASREERRSAEIFGLHLGVHTWELAARHSMSEETSTMRELDSRRCSCFGGCFVIFERGLGSLAELYDYLDVVSWMRG